MPKHSLLKRGKKKGCHHDSITQEYAAAIELIQRVLDAENPPTGLPVRYWVRPVGRIGADFFCQVTHAERGWFGLFADAAGHGLPAAIYALHIPLLFREAVHLGMNLPDIYGRLNYSLLRQKIASEFLCGTLVQVQGHDVSVINAGMPEVFLVSEMGHVVETFPSCHYPLGIVETGQEVSAKHCRLAGCDDASLWMYSDGFSELGMARGRRLAESYDQLVRSIVMANPDRGFDDLVDLAQCNANRLRDDISLARIPVPLPMTRQAS